MNTYISMRQELGYFTESIIIFFFISININVAGVSRSTMFRLLYGQNKLFCFARSLMPRATTVAMDSLW